MAPVGTEGQPVAGDQPVHVGTRQAIAVVAVQRAGRIGQRHVAHHAGDPQPSGSVAATVVEAHTAARKVHALHQRSVQAAVVLRTDVEQARFHRRHQATGGVQRDATDALHRRPRLLASARPLETMDAASFDIDPIQGLLGKRPQRTLAHQVARGAQHVHGAHLYSKGPVRTKAPPW